MTKNYVVTGGCGFQGSHLSESLAKEGHNVTILNTPSQYAMMNYTQYLKRYKNIRIFWGSILDKEMVRKTIRGCDQIFHLAAKINVDESRKDPGSYLRTNVIGTQNILDEAVKENKRVIHASSMESYGENKTGLTLISSCSVFGRPEAGAMNEKHPLLPQSPYAASKAAGDRLAYSYWKTYGLPVTIARPFNIYGTRQKDGGGGAVIPIFFRKAMNDEVLTIFGDGKQTRDYLYVTDLVRGYRIIAEQKELIGQPVNFGSGQETSIKWLAQTIIDIVGRGKIKHGPSRPGEVKSAICDNALISQYGFIPQISIKNGLHMYYEWLLKRNETYWEERKYWG